ncbi:hypothetical protein BD311DRAFT_784239 [Dichomitus squalens]|uniref:Tethering factor for nuclear proteasome STS1 n=1 Tax=Dichomitus squalens TaxID=114155 RepID=A0A4Q9N3U0_9APHY|nr:hypothetical protein BD311DRAFT_784239 [Dichomitus squalens]
MANVVTHPHLQVGFHPGPVGHSPSPLGFGFGLSTTGMMQGWPSPASHTQPSPWAVASPPSQVQTRLAKRRLEPEDEDRDERMDRSPTPERPKRAAPKRARTTPAAVSTAGKEQQHTAKENKPPSQNEESDVDVGFLLASLPPQSLLPLVTSLLSAQPALKSTILSLIPRPTLDTALQGLANSAQKLKEAYPYSNSVFSQPGPPSFSIPGSNRASQSSFSTGFGFGVRPAAGTGFGSASSCASSGGMREEYIISRLRPHIQEFVSACFSYLPYFSIATTFEPALSSRSHAAQTHASALRQQHKDKLHPTETYLFLAALTSHILSQPTLTQASLAPMLVSRLEEEWKAWVDHVDKTVNQQGGMFGRETVATWERGLDDFAQAKDHGMEMMKDIRDRWVSKVGWLVGRQPVHHMDEL